MPYQHINDMYQYQQQKKIDRDYRPYRLRKVHRYRKAYEEYSKAHGVRIVLCVELKHLACSKEDKKAHTDSNTAHKDD